MSAEKFEIRIDATACTSMVAGLASFPGKYEPDIWRYESLKFESGKIYGLVGEYGQGPMFLSYLLGGKVKFDDLRLYYNDTEIKRHDLERISWNLEPHYEKYKKAVVKKSIEKAIRENQGKEDFKTIADKFILTEPRYDRKLFQLSGERWRASAALGYACGKKIFYAPYRESEFYYQMCQSALLKALKELTASGAIVLLPVGSDEFLKHIADECIYIKRKYDVEELRERYQEMFGKGEWIH